MKVTTEEILKWINKNESVNTPDNQDISVRTVPSMIDIKQVVKDFKVTEEEAKAALDETYAEAKKLLPGETDDVYDYVVMQKIGEKFKFAGGSSSLEYAQENATEFNVTVLGISRPKDANDMSKRKCWTAFREDANAAITAGVIAIIKKLVASEEDLTKELGRSTKYVAVGDTTLCTVYRYDPKEEAWVNTKYEIKDFDTEKGKTLPLDNKATFENKDPNPNYQNPIPYKRTVEMIVNYNDAIYKAHGDVDGVHVGYKTSLWGSVSPTTGKDSKGNAFPYKGVIKVWKGSFKEDGVFNDAYKDAEAVLDTGYFHELSDVRGLPSWGMFATKGYVQTVEVETKTARNGTKYKKGVIIITGSDELKGLKFSTSYTGLISTLEDTSLVDEGDEVIVFGERASFKNEKGEWLPYNVLAGVIKTKRENKYADALKKMNKAISS